MKPIEIYCDPMFEIICPDCGMLFELHPKKEWKNYICPYCEKRFIAKNIMQAFWLEDDEIGESALV